MKKSGYIYLVHAVGTNRYKIGMTMRSVSARLHELNSSQSAYPLELIASAKFTNVREVETSLHRKYQDFRVHGEWFEFNRRQLQELVRSLAPEEDRGINWLWFVAIAIGLLIALIQLQGQQRKAPQPATSLHPLWVFASNPQL